MDLGCSHVTPQCRRCTQIHYSSPPAQPIALRSGIRRRKSGCTGPRRLGTIGNPLNKRKMPSQGCFFSRKGSNSGLCIYPGLACNGRNAPCTNACNQVCSQHKPLRLGTSFRTSSYSGGQDRWRPGCTTSPGERGRRPSYPAHG